VDALVLTLADIRIDGESLPGFRRKTITFGNQPDNDRIDLYAGTIPADYYNRIELIVDVNSDDQGSGPGSYGVAEGGHKRPIRHTGRSTLYLNLDDLKLGWGSTLDATVEFTPARALADDTHELVLRQWQPDYTRLSYHLTEASLLGSVMPANSQ
jgi:hypothetical protein